MVRYNLPDLEESVPKSHRELVINMMFQRITAVLVLVVAVFFVLHQGYSEDGAQESPERWEEIALIRLHIAADLDLRAENRRTAAIRLSGTGYYEAGGDALDGAGDDKFSASENYQKSNKYWQKVAEAYKSAGEETRADKARASADTAWESAKRTLREGTKLYRSAVELYENDNSHDKKIETLKKVARNLERLLEMK